MICFKGCKAEIDRLTNECKDTEIHLKMAGNVIQERDDIIINLTCKYKEEKLALLLQIDELQKKVDALELEKAKLITSTEVTTVHILPFKESNPSIVDESDWFTTSSATDKTDSDWNNDRQVTHSEVIEVPTKRPYKKHQAHLRKEKNRL